MIILHIQLRKKKLLEKLFQKKGWRPIWFYSFIYELTIATSEKNDMEAYDVIAATFDLLKQTWSFEKQSDNSCHKKFLENTINKKMIRH